MEHGTKKPSLTKSQKHILILLLILSLIIQAAVLRQFALQDRDQQEAQALIYGESLASGIALSLNNGLNATRVLKNMYLEFPDEISSHFDGVCHRLMMDNPEISSLYIAPNDCIQFAYPDSVKAATMGFEAMKDPNQGAKARQAYNTKNMALAGPHTLLEGGSGLSIRNPIYLRDEKGNKETFAGFTVAILNWDSFVEKLLKDMGHNENSAYVFAVWKDFDSNTVTDENGFIFKSSPQITSRTMDIPIILPNDIWHMTVEPKGGYQVFPALTIPLLVSSILILVLMVITYHWMITPNIEQQEKLKMALERAEISLAKAEAATAESARARQAAEDARLEAMAANKAKSEFLSNMSHDIRTPMNAIVGMTTIAASHIDDPKRTSECLRKIALSSKHLLGLINDVLDMAKIESGKMTLNPEALSLRLTTEMICDIVRPQIKDHGQEFEIIISNILAEDIYCDSVRINQVLLNFLSNAIKFTPKGGSITLRISQEASPKGDDFVRTHFYVKDTGMGMSDEFKAKLFHAFEREDNLRIHKTQGTGLGLTITKHIVDAMEGSIEVDSAVDAGTTFHVIIDFKRVEMKEEEMHLPDWSILVTDNSIELCETASQLLKEMGARPQYALNGKEALEKITEAHNRGEDFFAILLDYKMPGMNGVETARKIREATNVPISLISAYDWSEIEDEAKEAGIHHFISKPLFKSTLYHALQKFSDAAAAAAAREEKELPEESAAKADDFTLEGVRILLAEDMDVNAEIAKELLSVCGARVERAVDGKDALEMFTASQDGYYDVILMDLRMPNMNGIEATKAIRALDRKDAKNIPILAMTADAFAEDAQRCLEAGMNAHIAKPIDIDRVTKTIREHLK